MACMLNTSHGIAFSTTVHYFIDMYSTRMGTELKAVGSRPISTKTSMVRGAPMPMMGDVARAKTQGPNGMDAIGICPKCIELLDLMLGFQS